MAADDKKISSLPPAPVPNNFIEPTDLFPIIRLVDSVWVNYKTALVGSIVTLQGNIFNGMSQLVQTDNTGNLPAIPGGKILVTDPSDDAEKSLNAALLSIYNADAGTGTVTNVSGINTNGFTVNVDDQTTTPHITVGVSITGILYGNGTLIRAAVAGDFPTLNQNTTGNAATSTLAAHATSLAGGGTNTLVYQSATGSTAFLGNIASRILTTDGGGALVWSNSINANQIADNSITNTEYQYLGGLTSNIQTQLDNIIAGIVVKEANALAIVNINISNPGTSTFDGVTLTNGQILLLQAQSTTSENGLWEFNGAASALTRASTMDTWAEVVGAQVIVPISTTYTTGSVWRSTSVTNGTIGVTAITFAILPSGAYVQGTGVTIIGNVIAIGQSVNVGTAPIFLGTNFTSIPNSATTATSADTNSAIVARDSSGNFSATTITAALTGTASGNTTYTANNHGIVVSSATNAMTVIAPNANTTYALFSGGASADPIYRAIAIGDLPPGISNTGLSPYVSTLAYDAGAVIRGNGIDGLSGAIYVSRINGNGGVFSISNWFLMSYVDRTSGNAFFGTDVTPPVAGLAHDNTTLGVNAGSGLTDGDDNLLLGKGAGVSIDQGTNSVILGGSPGAAGSYNNHLIISDVATGNPIITVDNINVVPAANLFLATPNGSSGALSPRAIVAADLPPVTNLAGGLVNELVYQTGVGTTSFLATANSSVLVTSSGGVPSLSATLPAVGAGATTVTDPTTSLTAGLNTALANIWAGAGGVGTVTSVSVATTNGFAGTVATSTTTPAITIKTTINGLLKGNATAISAAASGTDYSAGTAALTTGILKSTTGTGALTIAIGSDFPTGINASTVTTTATSTNNDYSLAFVHNGTTGNQAIAITNLLFFNPSTNILTAPTYNGNVDGTLVTDPTTSSIGFLNTALANTWDGISTPFTPVDNSGATLVFTSTNGTNIRTGSTALVNMTVTYPVTTNTNAVEIGTLSFIPARLSVLNFITTGSSGVTFVIAAYANTDGHIYITSQSSLVTPVNNINLSGQTINITGSYDI